MSAASKEYSVAENILAISNHSDMVGGGEHSFYDLMTHLPDSWNPHVLLPSKGALADQFKGTKTEIQFVPLPPLRPWTIVRSATSLIKIVHLCIRYKISLIYGNGSRAALYGGIAAKYLRIPLVWHCRVADRDPCLDVIITSLTCRIITNSAATAARFSDRLQSKVSVVHNGIDLEWFSEPVDTPSTKHDDPTWKIILVVARVSRWKRHDVALSAFESTAGDDPMVHLVCIGAMDPTEPEWWSLLQEKTKGSAFKERIHWIGETKDMRPWYHRATLLWLPSENEPFGRVLVEAMASGLPVIATRGGGVPEIVRDGTDGLLVSVGDALDLAAATKQILTDEPFRLSLSRSARDRANAFSLYSHVSSMTSIFHTILHERDHRGRN
jgi:glycosyltransferase involved in cell wall biosynthesis